MVELQVVLQDSPAEQATELSLLNFIWYAQFLGLTKYI